MNRVYFQPVGDSMTKYEKCINTNINLDDLKPLLDSNTYNELVKNTKNNLINLWGIADGKDQSTKQTFETIQNDDWVIFSSHRTLWSGGKIIGKVVSPSIGEKYLDDQQFKNIYFITDKKNIDTPTADIEKQLNLQTVKINQADIIRRFDGLGLSKKKKINDIDLIDNDKLLVFLTSYNSKQSVSYRKTNTTSKNHKPKTTTPKVSVVEKEVGKANMEAKKTNQNKSTTVKSNSKPEVKKQTNGSKSTSTSAAKKTATKSTATKVEKTPGADYQGLYGNTTNVEVKKTTTTSSTIPDKKASDSVIKKETKVERAKENAEKAEVMAAFGTPKSATTVTSEHQPVLKIKPITNLSKTEQESILNNLPELVKNQSTFADRYYVLDSGLVIMIAESKKDIKAIKKYIKK